MGVSISFTISGEPSKMTIWIIHHVGLKDPEMKYSKLRLQFRQGPEPSPGCRYSYSYSVSAINKYLTRLMPLHYTEPPDHPSL